VEGHVIALDDRELSGWFMDLTEDSSGDFLCSLSEAVMKADEEDYSMIRPVLMDLKRKYTRSSRGAERVPNAVAKRKRPSESERRGGLRI
jgi:hypothetical protein